MRIFTPLPGPSVTSTRNRPGFSPPPPGDSSTLSTVSKESPARAMRRRARSSGRDSEPKIPCRTSLPNVVTASRQSSRRIPPVFIPGPHGVSGCRPANRVASVRHQSCGTRIAAPTGSGAADREARLMLVPGPTRVPVPMTARTAWSMAAWSLRKCRIFWQFRWFRPG